MTRVEWIKSLSMAKKRDLTFTSILKIFFKGIQLYFLNFEKLMKYLAFPVIGQIVGITIIFSAAYLFTIFVPNLTVKSSVFDNILVVFLLLLFITLPGFFIFCKAFWDYLVAMASLNTMASSMIESGKPIEDTSLHVELIRQRALSYILFLILISVIYAIGSFPLLWVLLAIGFVYLALSFQAFALEEDASPFEAIGISVHLVKGNFLKTLFLLVLLFISTYWFLPTIICWGAENGNLLGFFSYPIEKFINLLPIIEVNAILETQNIPFALNSVEISKFVISCIVSFIVVGFTLPIRSICCTMLYKELYTRNYSSKLSNDKDTEKSEKAEKTSKKKNIKDQG